MALDERLTRSLERAARPADPSGVYEELIRRRERRRIGHVASTAVGVLVVVVGSVGAYLALSSAVGSEAPRPGVAFDPAAFPPNGSIVFDRVTDGHGQHLWLSDADGSNPRSLTSGDVLDQWPAWSPDGRTVAFVRDDLENRVIRLAFLDVTDGTVTMSEGLDNGVARPDWSPDGSRLTFGGIRPSGIYVMNRDGTDLIKITDSRFLAPDNPEWSPDGASIAFSANLDDDPSSWDVYVVSPDGTGLRDLTNTPEENQSELVVGWLPNGNLLITRSPGSIATGPGLPLQDEVWLEITKDGDVVRTVYEGYANRDARQEASISPDGRSVVYFTSSDSDGTWVEAMDLDTGEVTRLVEGGGPAWGPASPDPVGPTHAEATGATGAGTDIGLEYLVCDVTTVVGEFRSGVHGTAYVASRLTDEGGCPARVTGGRQVLAVDVDGDASADVSVGTLTCDPFCSAFAAPDIDGDGSDELMIQNVQFSVAGLQLFEIIGDREIVPVIVAGEGSAPLGYEGFEGGEQPQFWLGGDEETADAIRCQPNVDATSGPPRAFVSVTSYPRPGTGDELEVKETTFFLEGRYLRVRNVSTFSWPRSERTRPFLDSGGCGTSLSFP